MPFKDKCYCHICEDTFDDVIEVHCEKFHAATDNEIFAIEMEKGY